MATKRTVRAKRTDQAKASGWGARWECGRTRVDERGEVTYFIEARRAGDYYLRSTGAHSLREARAEFALFETDPPSYVPKHERQARKAAEERAAAAAAHAAPQGPPPLLLTEALAREFIDYSRDVLELTPGWIAKKGAHLAWWREKLDAKDLRGLPLATILGLAPVTSKMKRTRAHRLAVLKSLYRYLREQRIEVYGDTRPTLTPTEDPLVTYKVKQGGAAQSDGKKGNVPRDHLILGMEHLTGKLNRSVVAVLMATGWHASEVVYFARKGWIEEPTATQRAEGTTGVLVTFHQKGKAKHWKRTAVTARPRAAAEAILANGSFDDRRVDKAWRAACRAASIPAFGLGQFRHIVAMHAKSAGVGRERRAEFLDHDPAVNARHYAQGSAPPRIPTPWDAIEEQIAAPAELPARPVHSAR